ncbi:glycoside hydrolase family 3 C-terminal domain-containing protein [Actinosynnema mirum]|uniref:Exo-alpha-(1->6)-L-arabinopyranosidase n=1 Tax=Actinosynnema mirum (strain ATCC 29888 / DSM 43827 / JCM 3225 / NBRC 14064 / NCIMB 13271 / NRRL B-12336 / IMRU 3971 / 101) TaxID=446462 RepID=C6WQK8_ACTMD|nr:glycoside hydrolase family 3 C-terminal domain-containing protein [Actinosynnema mirum]ACU38698.1 glycoside hydrolase family 3 domain protein [Actinosynnema mirum DSM 43827]
MSTDQPTVPASVADQAALGSGADMWTTKAVGDVPSLFVTDGPHGLRKQTGDTDNLGIGGSVPATCFPPAVGLAQSWDADLVERVGRALGEECQAEGVSVLLGPGVNIKRDPRCGRNFEYYSEDPLLSGALGAAWVRGVQSQGVGASLKHYAANNTETDRMRSSSNVDPRTLREVYLRPFQRVVEDAQPWTVMCAYNRINGVYASEDRWLLTDVLRGEWGFEGAVVSDWGAVRDRVAAVSAGLDLEMPGGGDTDADVVAAVEAGGLDPAVVELAATRVAALAAKGVAGRRSDVVLDVDAHHALAREVAARCVVLLKNDGAVLPLAPGSSVAVIGAFAQAPRFQGGGSSHVNPTRVDVPLDEIRRHAPSATFAAGFTTDGSGDAAALRAEAVAAAGAAESAVLFLGLAADQESEGFDREHIEIPAEQVELLAAVLQAQPRTAVVLSHGGALRLAPLAGAPALLDGALLGQAGGAAVADVLFGAVNPSGRLAETAPTRLEDTPAFLNFPGERSQVYYGEGLHVGYRWYDARDAAVGFPFGHGLSYTSFEHRDLTVSASEAGITASVAVVNTGERAGREVVQFYVSVPGSSVTRPVRELKGFASLDLEPGAEGRVEVLLRAADLSYWDVAADRWVLESGEYEVTVGASSRDLRASATVAVTGDETPVPFTPESTLGEVLADAAGAEAFGGLLTGVFGSSESSEDALGMDMAKMMASIPLERFVSLSGGKLTRAGLADKLAEVNAAR